MGSPELALPADREKANAKVAIKLEKAKTAWQLDGVMLFN